MIEHTQEKKIFENLIPLLEMEFILNLSGNKERSDFIYLSNKGDKIELINWENEKKILSSEISSSLMVLHPNKPIIVFIKDTQGDENFFLYTFNYETKIIKKMNENPLGSIIELIWLSNDEILFSGFDETQYYISKLTVDGRILTIYSTNKQILNMDYNKNKELLAVAIDRINTKIAIIDLQQMKFVKWLDGNTERTNFPTINSKGQIAYSVDQQQNDIIVIQNLDSLTITNKIIVPGNIGNWIFDRDAIQWINNELLFVKVVKNAVVSPYIYNLIDKCWIGPLSDLSINMATVTKSGIIWCGSKFDKGFTMEFYKNKKVFKIINSESIFDFTYENYWFTSFDNKQIQAWLVRNPNPQAPLLIYCHGGPTYSITNSVEPFLHALVLGGFTIFAINYRGSDTFGAEYRNHNIGDMGGGDLLDIIYGTRFIKNLLEIRGPVRIFGESYGAYLTVLALTKYPYEWLSGVAWGANLDLIYAYEKADSHYKSFYEIFLGGNPEEKNQLYHDRSPITHISKIKAPTLIIHGANDSRVPLKPILEVIEIAKQHYLPIECSIADDGHKTNDARTVVKNIILSILHLKNKIRNMDNSQNFKIHLNRFF
ncbi:MAG: alpha/beta hydrolase family protein [Candidatus Thorarchaeota archaeon]